MTSLSAAYTRTTALLTLDHINLSFGQKVVLRDVSAQILDVERETVTGQVVCVLGPSGIGKTRLARIMAGLDKPTSGRVLIGDNRKPVEKGLVGLVPQNYPLFDFATVKKNLVIAGRQAGLAPFAALSKAMVYVTAFDLTAYLDLYPAQLSGGTRQRVAIVRQLMTSDHYLIMDEPFSGLDPLMKRRALEVITKVASMDTLNTIIINTHDVTEGMAIADTVWLLGIEPGQPGARIVETIDMAALGFAWRPDITHDHEFLDLVAHTKDRFAALSGRTG